MNLVAILASLGVAAPSQIPDHTSFAPVLEQHVVEDLVDYASLVAERDALAAYMAELARPSQAQMDAAPKEVRLAFWINAYNACVLALIADRYPIEKAGGLTSLLNAVRGYPANSIQQIPGAWDRAFCNVAGRPRSLDEIEHQILRPIGEPRVHFAISCAARSCPPLAREPYRAETLEQQLEHRVRAFAADRRYLMLARNGRPVLHVNKVLDDVADDFGGREGILAFFRAYLPPDDLAYLEANGPAKVDVLDHDWTLNDTAVFGTDD